MIDTSKLIPQRKGEARLSGKTITTIGLVKKDVIKIDSLLKEKLVLSKVRYSILRRQNETDKRSRREDILENKKSRPQDYDVKSNDKRKGFGGFLGGILKALLAGIGFTIFKSLPALIRIGRVIKTLVTPLILGATVFLGAIARIASTAIQVLPDVKGKNFEEGSASKIDDKIETFKSAMINTAIAFAGGAVGGAVLSRILRGKTFTEKEAAQQVARKAKQEGISRRERLIRDQSDAFEMEELKKRGMMDEYNRIKAENELLKKQRKPRKIIKKIADIETFDDARLYQEQLSLEKIEREAASDISARRLVEQQSDTKIKDFKPLTKDEFKKEGRRKITAKAGEVEAEKKILDKILERETTKKQKKLSNIAQVRIDRTAGRRKGVPIDFSNVPDLEEMVDMEELNRLDAEMKGKKPKINASKLAGKKGLSKLLFNVGGEAFEQTVKQTIKASVGVVPIIGDLLGFILDVFLFGQPVGRAAFMALGSFIGSLIGGVFGLIGGPPGVFVGSILGGIGGDLLGGAFYDLIFRDNTAATISENLSQSALKKSIKGGVQAGFMRGGYAPFGGIVHAGEFVIDADSTRAIERKSPGFLMALNKAKGSQVDEVLETYMSYGNEGEGAERIVPLPFEKVGTRTVIANT